MIFEPVCLTPSHSNLVRQQSFQDYVVSYRKKYMGKIVSFNSNSLLFLTPFFVLSLSGCSGAFTAVNSSSTDSPFSCNTSSAGDPNSDLSVKRLSKIQYRNTVTTIFGASVSTALSEGLNQIPDDQFTGDIKKYDSALSETHIIGYNTVAEAISKKVSDNWTTYPFINSTCFASSTQWNTTSCKNQFVTALSRVFFRKSAVDISTPMTIFNLGTDKKESLQVLLAYFLQSPQFLYFVNSKVFNNSDYSNEVYDLASNIAFALTDFPPDSALLSLAESKDLNSPEVFDQEINRLIASQNFKLKLDRFLDFWIDMEKVPTLPSGPYSFVDGLNTTNLRADLIQEMREYFRYVILDQKGNYKNIMTSNLSFARTPASASIYEHPILSSAKPFETMGNSERKGLLLRAPLFFASSSETHPVLRGARFRSNFLCDEIPLPTADNLNAGEDVNTDAMIMAHSNRKRTDIKTSGAACIGCHRTINPVGFAFENFDSFGRFRSLEKYYDSSGNVLATHNIDTRAVMPPMNSYSSTISFDSAADFIQKVSEDSNAKACFSRKLLQFYILNSEKETDHCTLDKIYAQIDSEEGSILEALKHIVWPAKWSK